MTDVHAYRASDEFAAALWSRHEESVQFAREVIAPWDAAHPDTKTLWSRGMGLDRRCVGFADPGGPVPEGLSRNQQRDELLPKRGKAGDPWRETMIRMNQRPKLEAVFLDHGVDPVVWGTGRIYFPGMADTPAGLFLTWGEPHPKPGDHLTLAPLSEYYTAVEKRDQERAS